MKSTSVHRSIILDVVHDVYLYLSKLYTCNKVIGNHSNLRKKGEM